MSAAADLARPEPFPAPSRPVRPSRRRPTNGGAVVIPFRSRPTPQSGDDGDWSAPRLVRTTDRLNVAAPRAQVPGLARHPGRSATAARDRAADVHGAGRVRAAPHPLRLTRRGVVACVVACVLVSAAMLFLARATLAGRPASSTPASPATVVVEPGDTLWSIARAIAPDRDPRAEVRVLRDVNDLPGTRLIPGQVLRTS